MIFELLEPAVALGHAVCVIGAGPVGLSLGLGLARAGRRVLLLESGGVDHRASQAELPCTDRVNPATHASSDDTVRRGLGGTSQVWGAGCTPYDSLDFEARPHVPMSGAPISREVIAPYFEKACAYFGCGGPEFELADAPGGLLRSDRVIRFAPQADMGRRHRAEIETLDNLHLCLNTTITRLDLAPQDGKVSALEVRSGGRVMRVESPAVVLACGGIETARLMLCAQREHPSLLGGSGGPLGRYYMGHLSGSVARVHFSDRSIGARFDFIKSEAGPYYRRRMTFAPELLAAHDLLNIYFLPNNFPLADAAMESGALSALHLGLSARHLDAGYMRHYRPGYVRNRFESGFDVARHLGNVVRDPIGTAVGLTDIARQRFSRDHRPPGFFYASPRSVFAMSYHSEQAPNPDSRVTLSDRRDVNGVPLPRIDFRFGEADVQSVVAAHRLLDDLLRKDGWGRLSWTHDTGETSEHVMAQAVDGYHQIGLTRMSRIPRDGVVDSNLAVHGFGNLWIAGTGVLPTSSQAHPTFSAVALAIRLAEHLAR